MRNKNVVIISVLALIVLSVIACTLPGAVTGDLAEISYTITADNNVYATTNPVLAKEHGITTFIENSTGFILGDVFFVSRYEPYPMEEYVLGMHPLEEKTIQIVPTELPATKRVEREKWVGRLLSSPFQMTMAREEFDSLFGKTIVNNEVQNVKFRPWAFSVISINETTVKLTAKVKANEEYDFPGTPWKFKVTDTLGGIITLKQEPVLGQKFQTYLGLTEILAVNDEQFLVRRTPVTGMLVEAPDGKYVVTDITPKDIGIRSARTYLEETPHTLTVKLLKLTSNVRSQSTQ